MDFLSGETATHFLIAIAVVGLGLIAYAAVLKFLRERPVSPLMAITGGPRARRLTVVDAAVVDARRRVVLIRRDNVEHLVLIGGPTDVVIESRIGQEEHAAAVPAPTPVERAAAPRPQPKAEAQRPQPAPPAPVAQEETWQAQEAIAPSEDNNYTYGPNAVLDVRDFTQGGEPQHAAPQHQHQPRQKQAAAAAVEANAESIIEMLRARILNDAATTASMQAARQADATRRQVSTFERLLSERMQASERPQDPKARTAQKPAQTISGSSAGSASARASAAAAIQPAAQLRETAPEKARSEIALEMEVARILEELQTRRKQKQNP
jgi:hypothetical protein